MRRLLNKEKEDIRLFSVRNKTYSVRNKTYSVIHKTYSVIHKAKRLSGTQHYKETTLEENKTTEYKLKIF